MIKDTSNFKKCRSSKCNKKGEFNNGICDACQKQINKAYRTKAVKRKSKSINKKSNREYPKALKEAKEFFQKWARLKFADDNGMVKCVHGSIRHYKKIDGGHYIPAERLATCFDEINVNPQEKNKNLDMYNPITNKEYTDYMNKKYGNEAIINLEKRSHLNIKYSVFELKEIAKKYSGLCDEKIRTIK